MLVTKADGTVQEYDPSKLRRSLTRAGADENEISSIVRDIDRSMTEGMTTQAIYRQAFRMLRASTRPSAARYSLRRALFGLGPTGFPFEDFLARLFEAEGYTVRTRQILEGKCGTHEIDLAVFNATESFVVEAKFHMRPGVKSDMQTVLYSYARLLDLQQRPVCAEDLCGIQSLYVITNTKFTHTAVAYAECAGLTLLSWNYPKGGSLQQRIEAAKLFPVTALPSLSVNDKRTLLTSNVLLCRDILDNPSVLGKYGIRHRKAQAVIEEARQLCQG